MTIGFYVYCGAILAAGLWTLRHEFRRGGALSPLPARDTSDDLAEIFELPLPAGVEPYDVLATIDWIEAL